MTVYVNSSKWHHLFCRNCLINQFVVIKYILLYLIKTGVQIFIKRPPDGQFETQDVLTFLETFPLALIFYLEYLIHDLNNEVGTPTAP